MSKLKKLFGGINITWLKVIILAVVTAVYTALINQIPFLKETSFQNIAVNLECWFLFALIVIANCKKWWEASLKCFVFFLISQPLIYLIEVPFIGWGVFDYYKYWAIITVLTLPGAAVAFLVKKKNILSVLILSVANGYLAYQAVDYYRALTTAFPRQLLATVFCIALIVLFTLVFFDKAKQRIAAFAIAAAVLLGVFIVTQRDVSSEISLGDGSWNYSVSDENIIKVEMQNGNIAQVKAKNNGTTYITFINADGEEKEYLATVSGGGVYINAMD